MVLKLQSEGAGRGEMFKNLLRGADNEKVKV